MQACPQEHTPIFGLQDHTAPFQIWFAQVRDSRMLHGLEGLFAAADQMLLSERGLYLLIQVSESAFAIWHKTIADDITRLVSPGLGTGWSLLALHCVQQQQLCGQVRESCTWQTQFLHTNSESGAGEAAWQNQWEWQLEKITDTIGIWERDGVGRGGIIDEVVHNGDDGSQENVQGAPNCCVLYQLLARGTLCRV